MFKTIVWATDGSDAADHALPYAMALAVGDGHKLVVVHSKEVFHGRAAAYPVPADEEQLEAKILRQVAEAREAGLDATFELVGDVPGAAQVIADTARKLGADMIVVGTRGHARVAGLLLGSVTQRLLHIAPCPVLAVPAGTPPVGHAPAKDSLVVSGI